VIVLISFVQDNSKIFKERGSVYFENGPPAFRFNLFASKKDLLYNRGYFYRQTSQCFESRIKRINADFISSK